MHSLQAFEKSRGEKNALQTQQHAVKSHYQRKTDNSDTNYSGSCSICSAKHHTAYCPQYTSKTVQQRLAIIVKNKLCYNCLGHHRVTACRILKRCHKCGRKHHTTIHQNKSQPSNSESGSAKTTEATATSSKTTEKSAHVHSTFEQTVTSCTFLATTKVIAIAPNGETTKARALIDPGSEITLISERLVQLLKLPRKKSSIPLVGIGAKKSDNTRGTTIFKLKPHDSDHEYCFSAHILRKLTISIPSVKITKPEWPHLKGLKLADPDFLMPGSVDIVFGVDAYGQILKDGLIKGKPNSPIAQLTIFGWVISGPSSSESTFNAKQGYHVSLDRELHDLLHRFWELEEIPSRYNSSISTEEQECENHFTSTHSRDTQGRYIVKLPFKHRDVKLGDSRTKAVRIIKNLSKKFASDSQYAQAYSNFISEYEELQHMMLVPEYSLESESKPTYYLPHHGVVSIV